MQNITFETNDLQAIFKEIGLYDPSGKFYKGRDHKHRQVLAYLEQIRTAMSKLSQKRPIVMVDCGCGKSYLSFIIYEYCTNVLNRKVRIIGLDNNEELIKQCQDSAKQLDFDGMEFYATDVGNFKLGEPVDILYSLHACNTATDQMIAKGVEFQATYIFSVSCCQHRNRELISKHPLTSVTRFHDYKERLVDMLGDTMRALLLEHLGYGVNLYEFIAAEYTPKNIMLRAIKNKAKKIQRESALEEYKKLTEMFHFVPALEEMIKEMM